MFLERRCPRFGSSVHPESTSAAWTVRGFQPCPDSQAERKSMSRTVSNFLSRVFATGVVLMLFLVLDAASSDAGAQTGASAGPGAWRVGLELEQQSLDLMSAGDARP